MIDALVHLDQQLFHLINTEYTNGFLDAILPLIRNKYFWIPLYAVILVFLILKFKRKSILLIIFCLLAITISDQLSSTIMKPWIGRLRPCHDPGLGFQVRLLVNCGGQYSYFSSHASNHFSFAVFWSFMLKKWIKPLLIAGVIWAGLISYAQVYVGVHYPLDVLSGAVAGCIIGFGVVWIYRKFIPANLQALL